MTVKARNAATSLALWKTLGKFVDAKMHDEAHVQKAVLTMEASSPKHGSVLKGTIRVVYTDKKAANAYDRIPRVKNFPLGKRATELYEELRKQIANLPEAITKLKLEIDPGKAPVLKCTLVAMLREETVSYGRETDH